LQHGRPWRTIWSTSKDSGDHEGDGGTMQEVAKRPVEPRAQDAGTTAHAKSNPIHLPIPRSVFRMPKFSFSPSSQKDEESYLSSTPSSSSNRTITRIGNRASPMPSPRTVIYLALILSVTARASPLHPQPGFSTTSSTATETAGTIISWLSTLLYLGSRIPQLVKNHNRRSTEGLSAGLFIAAFFGNLFYSSSILTNPCAWETFQPYGGGGWVGAEGSNRLEWVSRAAPFWLGAAGVLFMDGAVGVQFLWFGDGSARAVPMVVVAEDDEGTRWKWRRVSGWMRGWVPSVRVAGTPRCMSAQDVGVEGESERLLGVERSEGRAYGGI
ncbi:hypothetical protein LTS18_012167, partial [Coniosporium uncinatum]